MLYNRATLIKRDILFRTCKTLINGNLEELNKIPYQAAPRDRENLRCCIHKDRAVLKYRTMAALGFSVEDEVDETRDLHSYGVEASNQTRVDPGLTVISDACSSCRLGGYYITDLCAGCVARPCTKVCPKNAIAIKNGRSIIDSSLCVQCGKCESLCPYNAIVKIKVPCENACPVGALIKDSNGVAKIDRGKCISCGKCVKNCPFGAITDKSQLPQVLGALKTKKVVALIAPSIVGQFPGTLGQLKKLILDLGYSKVIDVGNVASRVAELEAEEFLGYKEEILTSSCCPSYVLCAEKHAPLLKNYISSTPSPMELAGELNKKNGDIMVFIGPCFAKKVEASKSNYVDYVLTFEELGAHIMATGKDVLLYKDSKDEILKDGYGFAQSQGVTRGVVNNLRNRGIWITPHNIDGIDQKIVKQFKVFNKIPKNWEFLEVMACSGGCINGPGAIVSENISRKALENVIK